MQLHVHVHDVYRHFCIQHNLPLISSAIFCPKIKLGPFAIYGCCSHTVLNVLANVGYFLFIWDFDCHVYGHFFLVHQVFSGGKNKITFNAQMN